MAARGVGLLFLASLALICGSGCTHLQLQKNTINQMQTVHDIQQQQVLDNLAMFVCNPNSMPYFSIATQGSSAVADQASLSLTPEWQRAASGILPFFQILFTPSASRAATENWTLNPINDSVKLSLMRCAYQRAVANCVDIAPSCIDPNCNALFDAFYHPPKWSLPLVDGQPCGACCRAAESEPAASQGKALPHVPGIVSPSGLLSNCCWFGWGPKESVPEGFNCSFVGHHGQMYVWVPACGRNELTKLTLLICDIAYYDPPSPPAARTVEITIGSKDASATEKSETASDTTSGPDKKVTTESKPTAPSAPSQKATVPVGTSLYAVKLAHHVTVLKQLLAEHGLTEDSLIDYWARGIAGPNMNKGDISSIRERVIKLCTPKEPFLDEESPPGDLPDAILSEDLAPKAPCVCDIENYLLDESPNAQNPNQLIRARLKMLARLWSRGCWDHDGFQVLSEEEGYKRRLEILDFYRMSFSREGCNAFAALGTEKLDSIAYAFLAKLKVPKDQQWKWQHLREWLRDLEIPTTEPTPVASPVPYGGILGAAINLQNAVPPSTTAVLPH
jgi:hypothetical protein